MQARLWVGVGSCVAVAIASGVAEHRRHRRNDLDRVGVMPWPTIQFIALFAAVIGAAVALHS